MEVDSDGILSSTDATYAASATSLTENSIIIFEGTTSASPSAKSYSLSSDGIEFLDMEVQYQSLL